MRSSRVSGLGTCPATSAEQDQFIGNRTAPTDVVVGALEFLVEDFVAFGSQDVAQMPIRHKDRRTSAGLIEFHRSRVQIETHRQPGTVHESCATYDGSTSE